MLFRARNINSDVNICCDVVTPILPDRVNSWFVVSVPCSVAFVVSVLLYFVVSVVLFVTVAVPAVCVFISPPFVVDWVKSSVRVLFVWSVCLSLFVISAALYAATLLVVSAVPAVVCVPVFFVSVVVVSTFFPVELVSVDVVPVRVNVSVLSAVN